MSKQLVKEKDEILMKKEEIEKENEVKTFEIEELRNLINKLDGVIKKMEAETIDQKN